MVLHRCRQIIPERHYAVISHVRHSAAHCAYASDDVTLNWLPFDHVVPMLTYHLADVYLCRSAVQERSRRAKHTGICRCFGARAHTHIKQHTRVCANRPFVTNATHPTKVPTLRARAHMHTHIRSCTSTNGRCQQPR